MLRNISCKFNKIAIILCCFTMMKCSGTFDQVPDEQFVGTWKLTGRSVYEGVHIKIEKENDKLTGKISRLNDNKYVQMFMEKDQVWVPSIERTSIYQFRLTENKIAKELFSLYDMSPDQEYKVEFISEDTIGLAMEGASPRNSKIKYIRVE